MIGYTPVKCAGCSAVIYLRDEELPDGIQVGEFFERECGRCGEVTCMSLAVRDSEAVNK